MRRDIAIVMIMITLLTTAVLTYGQELSSYLLLNNIGDFRASKNPSSGQGSGIVVAAAHFNLDHIDTTYRISYFNKYTTVGPKVQVTHHSGVDSDKWVLHEIEEGYRDPDALQSMLTEGTVMRLINGNRVFAWGAGSYTWISGSNIVVRIEYRDLTGAKPEPLDVVKAYLNKYPSAITLSDTEAKSNAHSMVWIKDEIDRRLWLCDKWFGQLSASKTDQKTALNAVYKSMIVFVNYREKYFRISAKDEKSLLADYLEQNDIASFQAKLTEYQTWWATHKTDSISL